MSKKRKAKPKKCPQCGGTGLVIVERRSLNTGHVFHDWLPCGCFERRGARPNKDPK
jgi:DnaJ-class molecular chaperone